MIKGSRHGMGGQQCVCAPGGSRSWASLMDAAWFSSCWKRSVSTGRLETEMEPHVVCHAGWRGRNAEDHRTSPWEREPKGCLGTITCKDKIRASRFFWQPSTG